MQKQNIFAPRPFATPVEEGEAPVAGPGIGFSLADISILLRKTVQPKLRLGPVGDRYEQEADRVARRVVESVSSSDQGAVQRQEDLEDAEELEEPLEEEEEEELRRQVDVSSTAGGADLGPDLESAIQRARGRGQPLSDGVRQPMERAFGADFGGVRVHADGEADRLNRSLQARAFTTGQDVFLRRGEYRPGSSAGQRLLAHELTHVVQQNGVKLKQAQLLATRDTSKDKIHVRTPIDDKKNHKSGRVNARATEFSDLIQRDVVNFAHDATLPENIQDFIRDKNLHIFAHSSGRSLDQIETVNDMNSAKFAEWLADEKYVFKKGENTKKWDQKKKSNIYIHACSSSAFTEKVAKNIMDINDENRLMLHGTICISATWFYKEMIDKLEAAEIDHAKRRHQDPAKFDRDVPRSGVLIVINPQFGGQWIEFENKKNKTIEDLNMWAKRILLYPSGYNSFPVNQ